MLKFISVLEPKPMNDAVKGARATRLALASLCLAMLLSALGTSIANVALPTLTHAFNASFQAVQWVVLIYLLSMTTVVVSVGRLGDLWGRRYLLLIGLMLFTASSALCALAPNLMLLILARAIQGIGAAILMALTVALVRETVPKAQTGRAMGLLGTMSAIGTALGPSLGGVLIAGYGWQAIFLSMLVLGLVNLVLVHRYLPQQAKPTQSKPQGYDGCGSVLLGLVLTAYALAMTLGKGQWGYVNLVLLGVAVLAGGLFVLNELKVASPLIQLAAFGNQVFSASLAMNVLVAVVMMSTLVVGPFYLAFGLGLNAALVGTVMAVGPVISALMGVPAGRLTDRWGTSRVITLGIILMLVGTMALSVLPHLWAVWGYVIAIVILTPGYQCFQAANNTTVMLDVSEDQRGVISGMLSLARNLGLITGAAVLGALFAFAAGTTNLMTASAAALTHGMSITFLVASGLMGLALVILLVTRGRATPLLTVKSSKY